MALVGSGEFLEAMVEVDRSLMKGRPPRAVFLPTAAAEEGEASVSYWIGLGTAHFTGLGVEPVPLRVLTRDDADDEETAAAVAGAGLVYLSGGNPGYLASTLRGTLVWAAIESAWRAGAALAGCSAGACALSFVAVDVRRARARAGGGGDPLAEETNGTGSSTGATRKPTGLAVVPDVAVIPHYDRMLEWAPGIAERYLESVPAGVTVIGVDEETAIVSQPGGSRPFEVAGRQAAWVIRADGTSTRYGSGERIELPD